MPTLFPKRYLPSRILERMIQLPARVLFGFWMLMILGFALAYLALSAWGAPLNGVTVLTEAGDAWVRFGDALYFSVITATTLGYGDLVPLGWAKAFAAAEGAAGFFLFAVIISKFVSQKQETALRNVHKLAFQNAFFMTREGFFLVRRDCDAIATTVQEHGTLDEKAWTTLSIIYQKAQTLLEGILDFYDDFDWYDIDERREKLLLESVHRTTERIAHLLRTLDTAGLPRREHGESMEELSQLIAMNDTVLPRWRAMAFAGHGPWFDKITRAAGELAALS